MTHAVKVNIMHICMLDNNASLLKKTYLHMTYSTSLKKMFARSPSNALLKQYKYDNQKVLMRRKEKSLCVSMPQL